MSNAMIGEVAVSIVGARMDDFRTSFAVQSKALSRARCELILLRKGASER
jgi:hypothetical protein